MRWSWRIVALGFVVVPLVGCLVPHIHHTAADGWTTEWKLLWFEEDESASADESPVETMFKEGYGFNNEKNAKKAMERARR